MSKEQTQLIVINNTDQAITVYLTLGVVAGCVNNINSIPFVTTLVSGNPYQGSFKLQKKGSQGDSVCYVPPQGEGFNGNFSFGVPPANCPPSIYPTGVNLAEFMLNNSFQGANAQETIDISAIAGVNALLKFSMSEGGSWSAGPTQANVIGFENKEIGENVGQVGVYPYACPDCTVSAIPFECDTSPINAPVPPVPQTEAICNVQRNASESGGIVRIEFNGFV